MKRTLITLIIALTVVCLFSEVVGKIRFMVGEVQYKEGLNLSYKNATMNTPVHREGYFKTGPGSSVEVQWTNGSVSTVEANSQLAISKLLLDASTNANWKNKLWDKVNNLKTTNRSASAVAGIRREEAEVKKESELFWFQETIYYLQDAVDLYDRNEYARAIPIFEGVIQQAPLKKDAELSHAYLIMIYDELGDKVKQKKHIELLKADFPNSSTLDSLPPEQ